MPFDVIKVHQEPIKQCPACGAWLHCQFPEIEYCDADHARGITVNGHQCRWVDTTTFDSAFGPHLHKRCVRCAFEWIEAPQERIVRGES